MRYFYPEIRIFASLPDYPLGMSSLKEFSRMRPWVIWRARQIGIRVRRVKPSVDWSAAQIEDPIWRLRFLQAVAPRPGALSRVAKTPALLLLVAGCLGFAAIVAFRRHPDLRHAATASPPRPAHRQVEVPESQGNVWLVEKTAAFETYSNGLRLENGYVTGGAPRHFLAYPVASPESRPEQRSAPVGIVYHTTESLLAPFEPSQNTVLKRVGESLLDYVRRRRCYHFLIDRFGRVFRIVDEASPAGHAGNSVWADSRYAYLNLNDSFIGISFEAQTGTGESATTVEVAQVRAAAMLTEMLRRRYGIDAVNCVTHAQVSVNPLNMKIGYHLDWASSFPFDRIGLPDNYALPSPAIRLFGFEFDTHFEERAGPRMAASAALSGRLLAERAASAGVPQDIYRQALRHAYHRLVRLPASSPAGAADGSAE